MWFGRGSTGCVGVTADPVLGRYTIVVGNEKHGEQSPVANLTDAEIEMLGYYLLGVRSPNFVNMRDAMFPKPKT
tara:strand:- start:332 stop:553 length:222 start_codon:yes stop_codon:yes gene_type:complete